MEIIALFLKLKISRQVYFSFGVLHTFLSILIINKVLNHYGIYYDPNFKIEFSNVVNLIISGNLIYPILLTIITVTALYVGVFVGIGLFSLLLIFGDKAQTPEQVRNDIISKSLRIGFIKRKGAAFTKGNYYEVAQYVSSWSSEKISSVFYMLYNLTCLSAFTLLVCYLYFIKLPIGINVILWAFAIIVFAFCSMIDYFFSTQQKELFDDIMLSAALNQ